MKTICILLDTRVTFVNSFFNSVSSTDIETFLFLHDFISKYKKEVFTYRVDNVKYEIKFVSDFLNPKDVFKKDTLKIREYCTFKVDETTKHKDHNKLIKELSEYKSNSRVNIKETIIELGKPNYEYIIYSDNKEFKNLRFKNKNITIVKNTLNQKQTQSPFYKHYTNEIHNYFLINNLDYVYLVEPYFKIMTGIGILNVAKILELPREFILDGRKYYVNSIDYDICKTQHEFSSLWCKVQLFTIFKSTIFSIINYEDLLDTYEYITKVNAKTGYGAYRYLDGDEQFIVKSDYYTDSDEAKYNLNKFLGAMTKICSYDIHKIFRDIHLDILKEDYNYIRYRLIDNVISAMIFIMCKSGTVEDTMYIVNMDLYNLLNNSTYYYLMDNNKITNRVIQLYIDLVCEKHLVLQSKYNKTCILLECKEAYNKLPYDIILETFDDVRILKIIRK